jgi:hypothetical protein
MYGNSEAGDETNKLSRDNHVQEAQDLQESTGVNKEGIQGDDETEDLTITEESTMK